MGKKSSGGLEVPGLRRACLTSCITMLPWIDVEVDTYNVGWRLFVSDHVCLVCISNISAK